MNTNHNGTPFLAAGAIRAAVAAVLLLTAMNAAPKASADFIPNLSDNPFLGFQLAGPDGQTVFYSVYNFAIWEANLFSGTTANFDAFDSGHELLIGGVAYRDEDQDVAIDITPDRTTITGDPRTMSGLDASSQFTMFEGLGVVRTLMTFTNNTAQSLTRTVTFDHNMGHDGNANTIAVADGTTQIRRWYVVDDFDELDQQPATTFVLYGEGSPEETPVSLIPPVANDWGVDFSLTVEPGETERLLFYTQLNRAATTGAAAAPVLFDNFDSESPLLAGMAPVVRSQVVNYDTRIIPEPATAMLMAFAACGLVVRRRST